MRSHEVNIHCMPPLCQPWIHDQNKIQHLVPAPQELMVGFGVTLVKARSLINESCLLLSIFAVLPQNFAQFSHLIFTVTLIYVPHLKSDPSD